MKKKLTLQDFADYIVQQEGIAPKDADAFVRAFFDVIEEGLHEDKFVKIKGFGTFKLVSVSERESVNVNTGERIQISGHTKVSFTPDNTMKELVNRPFAHFETVDLNDDTDTKEFEEIDEEMEAEESEEAEDANAEESDNAEEGVALEEETEETSTHNEVAAQEEVVTTTAEEEPNVTSAHNVTDNATTQTDASNLASPNSINSTTPTTTLTDEGENDEDEDENNAEDSSEDTCLQSGNDTTVEAEEPQPIEGDTSAEKDEDIVVTDPTPISSHTPQTDNSGTTSNTLGYTYSEVPSRKKHNWWRTLALTLCVIMLMAGSYFAGYYRILCPECNDIFVTQPIEVADTTTAQPIPTPAPAQPVDTVKTDSTKTKAEAPTPPQAEEKTATNTTAAPTSDAKPEKDNEAKAKDNTEKRPAIYRVKPGDNLSRIAKKYYGDDKYAERIIRHNNLKDANTIHVGMDLRLP